MGTKSRLDKNIFLTGHRGFVGTNAFQYFLKRGYQVSGADLKEGVDLTDTKTAREVIKYHHPSIVVNFAAITQVEDGLELPKKCIENNTQIIINLCELARGYDFKLVHISTDKVYGEGMNKKENSPLRAVYPYDVSKLCCEKILNSYNNTYGIRTVIVRPCNIYGKNDNNYRRIIPSVYSALFDKSVLKIRSDGLAERDYIYIEDFLTALELVLNEDGIFNITSGENFSVFEILNMVNEILPDKLKYVILNQVSKEIRRQSLNAKKLNRMGFVPQTTMAKFLGEFLCKFR
jgi:UDP-glucose 4-epimerase